MSGPNGAGKSSLLEAVYLLATTRSFRTARLEECVAFGGTGFRLRGRVEAAARVELEVGYGPDGSVRRRNGREVGVAEYLGTLPVVVWAPAERDVLAGGPEARRRFLDRGILGLRPADLALLRRYREALRQKRRLLAAGGRGLVAWNETLAAAAAAVISRRGRYVEELAAELAKLGGGGRGALPPLEVRYRPSPPQGLDGQRAILEALSVLEDEERDRRQPLAGPHRDELEIIVGGRAARHFASAGERKAAGLLLVAAQGRRLEAAQRRPIYLLDDLDAELDADRLETLWGLFAEGRQVVAASSRPALWRGRLEGCWTGLLEGRVEKTEVLSFQ